MSGEEIKFKAKIVAPYFKEIPQKIDENWAKKTKQARGKTYRCLKKAVPTKKVFKEKIAKRTKETIASFIDKKFVSKHDRTHRNIMDKTDESLERAGKEYPQRVKAGYQPGKYEEDVEYGRKEYVRQWLRITGPLQGYKGYKEDGIIKGQVKGLSALGVMAICADPELKKFSKDQIDTIEGITCRAVIEKPGRFRLILGNRILHWGREIIGTGYKERVIKQANEDLNRLVNEYRRPEIAPFISGGDSHIDFMVVEVPDLDRPGMRSKWLGLDIQVTKK